MTENSWRRRINTAYRRKVAVNQRLRDALAFLAIQRGFRWVRNLVGKTEQTASDDRRRRGVAVAIVHAFIVKVIPGNGIFRQFADNIVRDLHSSGKNCWIMRGLIRLAESVERPPSAATPRGAGFKTLERVFEQ